MSQKLSVIQGELHAPKSQYNKFGNYAYRNCEDILMALKPLLAERGCSVLLSDEILNIGDRFYIKATAEIFDGTGRIFVTAMAREEQQKKGMDAAQITGAASSYARKYALNGLFAIDDNKDPDSHKPLEPQKKVEKVEPEKTIDKVKSDCLTAFAKDGNSFGLFCFGRSINEDEWEAYFSMLPKGSITKSKEKLRKLMHEGKEEYKSWKDTILGYIMNGDDSGIKEEFESISRYAKDLILSELNVEQSSYMREVLGE